MVRISKPRKEGEPELYIPSDRFNRGVGNYHGTYWTVEGEPFEGDDAQWQAYLETVIPTDEDEKILREQYLTQEWIQYREWKGN